MSATQYTIRNASILRNAAVLAALGFAACLCSATSVAADEWMTWASSYTHEPVTGGRIDQYALPVQPEKPYRADFQRSGFRHYRSTLQAGQTSDNVQIVEQWGRDVQPYEQWRFPFRPYGVPYDAWGPQLPYSVFNAQIGQPVPYPIPGQPGGVNPGIPGQPPATVPPGPHPGTGYPYPPGYGQPGFGYPGYGYPGYGYPGYGYPGYGYPGYGAPYPGFGGGQGQFPLTPQYNGQPWFDGNYPEAPPLGQRPYGYR